MQKVRLDELVQSRKGLLLANRKLRSTVVSHAWSRNSRHQNCSAVVFPRCIGALAPFHRSIQCTSCAIFRLPSGALVATGSCRGHGELVDGSDEPRPGRSDQSRPRSGLLEMIFIWSRDRKSFAEKRATRQHGLGQVGDTQSGTSHSSACTYARQGAIKVRLCR